MSIIDSSVFKCYSNTKRKVADIGKGDAVLSAHGCFIFACKSRNDILLQKSNVNQLLFCIMSCDRTRMSILNLYIYIC